MLLDKSDNVRSNLNLQFVNRNKIFISFCKEIEIEHKAVVDHKRSERELFEKGINEKCGSVLDFKRAKIFEASSISSYSTEVHPGVPYEALFACIPKISFEMTKY